MRCSGSLHLVEHVREGGLELQRLLDLVGTHIRILTVFQEAWALMLANELDEFLGLRFPILRKAFKVFEDSINAGGPEESHGILGVLVKVCVKDPLIHKVGLPVDRKEEPAQVVQFENGEAVGLIRHCLFDVPSVLVEHLFPAGDDLSEDRKAVARRALGKIGPYLPCSTLSLKNPPFGIAIAAGLVPSPCWVSDIAASFLLSDIAQSVGVVDGIRVLSTAAY